jgi:hypothetical protein
MTRAGLRVLETNNNELKTGSRDDRNYCLNAQGPIGSTHPEHDPKKACPGPDPGIMLKRQANANGDST